MVLPFKSWFGFRDYAESEFLYFNVLLVGKRNIFKCLRLENKKRTFDEYRSLIGKKFKIKSDSTLRRVIIMSRSLKLRLTDEFDDVRSKVMRDPRTREELLDRYKYHRLEDIIKKRYGTNYFLRITNHGAVVE